MRLLTVLMRVDEVINERKAMTIPGNGGRYMVNIWLICGYYTVNIWSIYGYYMVNDD